MDTAQHQPAAQRCLVFLHPAVSGNPDRIREIHAATGLVAVVASHGNTVNLIYPTQQPDGPWDGGSAA